jgi:ATP synthase protein I
MVRPLSTRYGRFLQRFSAFGWAMAPNPDDLQQLGQRLDETQKRHAAGRQRPPPSQMGIAGRFATELVAAVVVGAGLGWGIDWLCGHFGFHTRPVFLVIFFVLGAAAGINNVVRAANEINAAMAAKTDEEK